MKLALLLVIPTLLLPALVGGAVASVAAAPPTAQSPAPPLSWVPEGGYPDRFPFGQCTWWAAYNHPVSWNGNAADWLTNAQAEGIATSTVPSIGAIVVYRPGGRYSAYGHVAIVIAVSVDSYTVSEMNAPTWGVVVTRVVQWPDGDVLGFIPRSDA